MKEATGELSTTVIAIVAIAAVLTIFTTLLLPTLRNQIRARMHCSDAICEACPSTQKSCNCEYYEYDDNGKQKGNAIKITCTNPNFTAKNSK